MSSVEARGDGGSLPAGRHEKAEGSQADAGPIGFIHLDGRRISSNPEVAKRQLLDVALKEGVKAARNVFLGLRMRRAGLGLDRPPVAPEQASGMMAEASAYEAVIAAMGTELDRWAAFERDFEAFARKKTIEMLDFSVQRSTAERDRYGLTKTTQATGSTYPASRVAYGMAENLATMAMASAARQLLDALDPLQKAVAKLEAVQVPESTGAWEFDVGLRPEPPDPAVLAAAQEEVRSTQERYLLLRHEKQATFPVLASFAAYELLHTYDLKGVRRNLETIGRGAKGGDQTAALVAGDVFQKLENVATVRKALDGGKLNVWSADNLVGLAKVGLGVAPGSLEDKIVNGKVADDQSERGLRDMFVGVVAMALGLIAAPLTGGGSLAVAAGITATAGSVALTGGLAIVHFQEYQLAKAMNATDFDKAMTISSEEPTLFWLALEVVLAGVDGVAALHTFRKLAPLARNSVSASDHVAEAALDALEKAAAADDRALGRTVRQAAERQRRPLPTDRPIARRAAANDNVAAHPSPPANDNALARPGAKAAEVAEVAPVEVTELELAGTGTDGRPVAAKGGKRSTSTTPDKPPRRPSDSRATGSGDRPAPDRSRLPADRSPQPAVEKEWRPRQQEYRDPPKRGIVGRAPNQLGYPDIAAQRFIDEYNIALAQYRKARELFEKASPAYHSTGLRRVESTLRRLEELEQEALLRGDLVGHVNQLSAERQTLTQLGLKATRVGETTLHPVATVGGRLRGLRYEEVQLRLGRPKVEDVRRPILGKDGLGSGSISWKVEGLGGEPAGGIRLDLPAPYAREKYLVASNPHVTRLLPDGTAVDELGIIVPFESTAAHIEIEIDDVLRDLMGMKREGTK